MQRRTFLAAILGLPVLPLAGKVAPLPERLNILLEESPLAAGVLLIQEAGGMVADPLGGEAYLKTGDIVCGTPRVFKSLLQVIQPHAEAMRDPG